MIRPSSLALALAGCAAIAAALGAQSVPGTGKSAPAVPVADGRASDLTPDRAPRPIRVEAIATDRNGKPILNLRPEDFTILENGAAQKIQSATLISRIVAPGANRPAASPATPTAVDSPEDEERAAKEEGTRVIGLYLDEFHVSAGASTERVRAAAAKFVDEQLRPADLLVVLKPLDHLTDIRLTRSRDRARQVIAAFSGRKDDYTPRTTFEEQYMGRSAAAVRAARAQIVLSGVRALAMRIGELDGGLSAIVMLTEGFAADGARTRERRLPDLEGLVRTSSRAHVMLYAFDPSASATLDPKAAAATAAPVGDELAFEALRSVARQTGGDALAPGEDLHAGLQRASRDLDAYYVLTYRSTNPSDGRFRELQISSTRRVAHVRSRAGYWAPLPPELRTARAVLPALIPMRAVRRSPLIESWFGTMMEPDGRRRVIFTWAPAPASTRGKPTARPDLVTLKVSTPAGNVLFEGDVSPAYAGAAARRANSAVFETATGRLQFDLTILRADGSTLDTSAQDFDVPELRGSAPVILQPQLFTAASAREFREIAADSNAAPLPAREFRRTAHLLMRVPTYDPGGGEVKVSARLMNQVGAVLADLDRAGDAAADKPAQFDLSLARFAPGEYSLEVAANSRTGTSRQLIRFKITG